MFSLEGFQPNLSYWIWIGFALLMSIRVARTYGWLSSVTFAWFSFSALRIFAAPISPYVHEEEIWNSSLSQASACAFIGVVLVCSCIQMFTVRAWIFIFNLVAILNSFLILGGLPFGAPYGLLFNASMSGCLNAVLFPLFFERDGKVPILSAIVIPLSVLATQKNQPIALLFFSLGVVLIKRRHWKELALAIAASFLTGLLLIGHMFGNSEGRTEVWTLAFNFFRDHANPFLGTGLGTFYYIGPWLTLKPFGQGFLWLHSDWLQIGFECGAIGLVLMALLFFRACYRSRGNLVLSTSLLTFGAFGIANFPLHNPISACLGAFLLHWALVKAPREKHTLRQN